MNRTQTANTIVRFFRAFQISIPAALVSLIVLYFGIFQAYKTFNPDLSGVEYTENKSENPHDSGGLLEYGNSFNKKAYYNFIPAGSIHSTLDTEMLRFKVSEALKYYKIQKLKESLLYSSLILLGLPLLMVLVDFINKGSKWVKENKTI